MCERVPEKGVITLCAQMRETDNTVWVSENHNGRVLLELQDGILTVPAGDAGPNAAQQRLLAVLGELGAETARSQEGAARGESPAVEGRRRKLWELAGSYHCPVIGTCAGVAELRKVARQAGLESEARLTDYEVHSSFVGLAGERNPASKRLHKLLERKHARAVRRFAEAADETALARMWQEARNAGDIAGALWAVMTHAATTPALAQTVYGEVHMLSHQAGAVHRADVRRLPELEQENRRLQDELQRNAARSAQSLADKDRRIRELNERLARAREAEARAEELESGRAVQQLKGKLADLEQRLAEQALRTERAERDAEAWRQRHEQPDTQPPLAAGSDNAFAQTACGRCDQAEDCPHADLSGRCVLCVGGLTGTTDRYRRLVEEYNGRFLHHDGGLEDNAHRLTSLLQRADAVVCPADCVSHEAARRVKYYCKRHNKTCVFLRSSGAGSFAGALSQLADSGRPAAG